MTPQKSQLQDQPNQRIPATQTIHATSIPGWVLLPLRLFLGITFIYAGIQKLTDPQFFQPNASGFVGKQIATFAQLSPLHTFLLHVAVPHATFFGLLVAYGEIAIGLGTLFGFLLRPAAFFGLLLSLIFFLSVTWRIYPYFYGADIVFIFCWITLLLNGPLNTSLPTLDEQLYAYLIEHTPQQLSPTLHLLLGIAPPAANNQLAASSKSSQDTYNPRLRGPQQRAREKRRSFLLGMFTGSATILGFGAIAYALSIFNRGTENDTASVAGGTSDRGTSNTNTSSANNTAANNSPATDITPTGTASNAGTPSSSTPIAKTSAVPTNSALTFTIPANGDPGILVHLNNGQFVAYDALCTHAGCQVDYDASSQLLVCPCHGASFDPSKNGAVVDPPAPVPLPSIAIHVDSATGAITITS
ncbi:MAG TPA: TQO small subunit DoxD [Ktedonobacteraceae bacterium]|nr:TQO small subunit DoxD [Ktedonobacteraceae bacterium]